MATHAQTTCLRASLVRSRGLPGFSMDTLMCRNLLSRKRCWRPGSLALAAKNNFKVLCSCAHAVWNT